MEVELGPCAEFSLYHLMDLETNEQRLFSAASGNAQVLEGPLLRGIVSKIGKGSSHLADRSLPRVVAGVESPPRVVEPPVTTPDEPVHDPHTLSDLCRILRSKNAGPYEVTIDAMFSSKVNYDAVKASGILSPSNVAKAIGIMEEEIIWIGFFEPALSFKVTIPRIRMGRKKSAGGFMENDIHGSQEHMGLSSMRISKDIFNQYLA